MSVLHRPVKEGLGPAYIAGFEWALRTSVDLILEMDCDFSHDPADVPKLVAAMQDADLALGSRYVQGGRVVDWGLLRRGISRAGCLYARSMLGLGIQDLTGGFKCYRRQVLETIGLGQISSRGYAFQIETTYRTVCAGLRVVEVPIVFADRNGRLLEDERRHCPGSGIDCTQATPCVTTGPVLSPAREPRSH